MAVHESYLVFVLDQLGGAGEVVSKKMFGGAGIYLEGFMLGLIYQNSLYLNADRWSAFPMLCPLLE